MKVVKKCFSSYFFPTELENLRIFLIKNNIMTLIQNYAITGYSHDKKNSFSVLFDRHDGGGGKRQ